MSSFQPVLGILENALDYLVSAAEYLVANTKSSRKYSVLHLFAGIELLLKERLSREHWSLLFADVNKANRAALQSGDFKSVDFDTCVYRLSEVAGVTLKKDRKQQLERLRTFRNRLQHFHSSMDEAETVSRLFYAFSFVVEFVANELHDVEETHGEHVSNIHIRLNYYDEYVKHRLAEVRSQVEAAKFTVDCPECEQDTLILGSGNPRCAFCEYTDEPFEAMAATLGDEVIGHCPDCGGMMGQFDVFAEHEIHEHFVCFICGTVGR